MRTGDTLLDRMQTTHPENTNTQSQSSKSEPSLPPLSSSLDRISMYLALAAAALLGASDRFGGGGGTLILSSSSSSSLKATAFLAAVFFAVVVVDLALLPLATRVPDALRAAAAGLAGTLSKKSATEVFFFLEGFESEPSLSESMGL